MKHRLIGFILPLSMVGASTDDISEEAARLTMTPAHESDVLQEIPSAEAPAIAAEENLDQYDPEEAGAYHFLDDDQLHDASQARGNWYTKREHVKKAFEVYQEIQRHTLAIEQMEQPCLDMRTQAIDLIDSLWFELGVPQATCVEYIRHYVQQMQVDLQKERPAPLTKDEVARLKERLSALDVLAKGIDALDAARAALDSAIHVGQEQINKARDQEHEAFTAYEKMIRVLSDDLVVQFAAQIDTCLSNVNVIKAYIANDLLGYMYNLIEQVHQIIADTKSRVQTLKEAGVDVTQPLPPEEPLPEAPAETPSVPVTPVQSSTWEWLMGYLAAPFIWIYKKVGG